MKRVLALESGDPTDLLTLAVVTLKAGEGAVGLAEVGALLARADQELRLVQPSDPRREEYRVTHAYYLALSGEMNAAEEELRAVISEDPQDVGAAKGITLLEKG